MPIHPVDPDQIEFVPPLELPLKLNLPDGRFGADRTSSQSLPDGSGNYRRTWFHGGVDLVAEASDLVYAVQAGNVVQIYDNPSDASGSGPGPVAITIDHEPNGSGYLSRYLHLGQSLVHVGDHIRTGEAIGRVGQLTIQNHLHFELCYAGDRPQKGSNASEPIRVDPTTLLYRCERIAIERQAIGSPQTIPFARTTEIGQTRMDMIPFFYARVQGSQETYHIPLYQPSPPELTMVAVLRDAFNQQAKVELMYIHGMFFGDRRIITHVRMKTS